MNFKKTIIYAILLVAISYGNLNAAILQFKAGQKASYLIDQTIDVNASFEEVKMNTKLGAQIGLDVVLVSLNEETLSYPFEVEVTMRKILATETIKGEQADIILHYDSEGMGVNHSYALAQYVDQLIDQPLRFRVEAEFQAVELTGALESMYEDYQAEKDMGLFETVASTYEIFLTQLFQLSGEDLLVGESYPVNCYKFMDINDEPMDESAIAMTESSAYTVEKMDDTHSVASWLGTAKIASDALNGEITLSGAVTWDGVNPMVQERTFDAQMQQTLSIDSVPANATVKFCQKWKAA